MSLINIINGLFSFWQERAAKKATDALNNMLPTYVDVIRGGKKVQIDSKKLVPGDVFVLQAGNSIPADARIISASSMQVDQSALNGESVPESKTTKYDPGEGSYAESNLVYSGTTVGAGNADDGDIELATVLTGQILKGLQTVIDKDEPVVVGGHHGWIVDDGIGTTLLKG